MKRPVLVLLTSVVLLLALATGSALADAPAVQSADQSASTDQGASAGASAQQVNPSNSVVDIRIGSPGDSGSIEQSNNNSANAAAGNQAATGQSVGQAAGGSGVQTAGQSANTSQGASAAAQAVQVDPSNDVVRIRIHSSGKDGSVSQSNDNSSNAKAGNGAATEQGVKQGSGGGGGVQDAEQSASTDQGAKAESGATQDHPSNDVVRIRIHSPGGDGDVKQSNNNSADAGAGNAAKTGQYADQSQGGGGGTQYAGQEAGTEQSAGAGAEAVQSHPSNSVDSIRIHSAGDDGSITQSNDNSANARAGNAAETIQGVAQDQGGSGSGGTQASDQQAYTGQQAGAYAKAHQYDPSNEAGGVRIDSPGGDGNVDQSNSNAANAESGNAAETQQGVEQVQGATDSVPVKRSSCDTCGGGKSHPAVQAAGQSAATKQSALSGADALQSGASNSAGGVRKDSAGGGGSVRQSNDNAADSAAGNKAGTAQRLQQVLGGPLYGIAAQAAGQDAHTGQQATSYADALQKNPCNVFYPVAIDSPGGYGSVGQYNDNAGTSRAGNAAATLQQALQLL